MLQSHPRTLIPNYCASSCLPYCHWQITRPKNMRSFQISQTSLIDSWGMCPNLHEFTVNIETLDRRESSLERLAFHAMLCRCSSSRWKKTLVYATDVAKILWCRVRNFRNATGNDRALLHWRNDLFILWGISAPLRHLAELRQNAFLVCRQHTSRSWSVRTTC